MLHAHPDCVDAALALQSYSSAVFYGLWTPFHILLTVVLTVHVYSMDQESLGNTEQTWRRCRLLRACACARCLLCMPYYGCVNVLYVAVSIAVDVVVMNNEKRLQCGYCQA